jgi:hypothetical protein
VRRRNDAIRALKKELDDANVLIKTFQEKGENLILRHLVNRSSISAEILLLRHDQKSRFSICASRIEIYYSRLTPIISRLLIVNTMLPTC